MRLDDYRMHVRDARNRFSALPQQTRWGVWLALEAVLVVVLGILDTSLGGAAFVAVVALWLPKIDDVRIRLGVQVALVVALLVVEPSAGILIAIAFALTWVPQAWRGWLVPATVLAAVVSYPYYVDRLFTIPLFGSVPSVRTAS